MPQASGKRGGIALDVVIEIGLDTGAATEVAPSVWRFVIVTIVHSIFSFR